MTALYLKKTFSQFRQLGTCSRFDWRVSYWWIVEFSNMSSILGSSPWWYLYIRSPTLYMYTLLTERTQSELKSGSLWALRLTPRIMRIASFCNSPQVDTIIIPSPNEVGGGYTGFTLSVRPSVRPSVSVCRRHGFRSISQVSFGISISNFICMLMVAIGRSLLIFSDVTFKMAAFRPFWIFWFPDSNFTLALNINFKLQRHNTYVYG